MIIKGHFRQLPIKWKITLVTLSTSAVVLLLAVGALQFRHAGLYRAEMRHHLASLAQVVGANCAAALVFDDPEAATSTLSALSAVPSVVAVGIIDPAGQLFATHPADAVPGPIPQTGADGANAMADNGGALTLFQPIELDGQRIGTVFLRYDLADYRKRMKTYVANASIIIALGLAVTFVLSWQLQGLISRSIQNLARITREISANRNYSIRAPRRDEGEVGQLIDSFNGMLEQIQARDAALQQHRDNLEEEVAVRTAEMHLQNKALEKETREHRQTSEALRYRVEFERLVGAVSTHFVSLEPAAINHGILDALTRVGKFADVDRCYVVLFHDNGAVLKNAHEWCASAITPRFGEQKDTPASNLPWLTEQLLAHQVVRLSSLDELPADVGDTDRRFLEQGRIRSMVAVPMISRRGIMGLTAFDAVHHERSWTDNDVDLLRLTGEIFANALERQWSDGERRHLEEQMRQTQKLESLGILAGGIAHDFNNLLMAVLGNAELALEDAVSEPVRESLEQICKATQQAAGLCQQMLAYSGRGQFVICTIDLNTVIVDLASLLRASISKKANLQLELDDTLPSIRGDITQIRQVVMNLLTNAAEALRDNEGVIRVCTSMRHSSKILLNGAYMQAKLSEGDYVVLEVTDNGCGMSSDTLRQIFDPFFTTKFTGRGLGLAAVLGIVRGHHGTIEARSTLGEGTCFTVCFPAIPVSQADLEDRELAHAVDSCPSIEGTILVVDDEPAVLKTVMRMVQRLGYDVLAAKDGTEAIEMLRRHKNIVRAVLLDLTMPRMNGYDVLREMRNICPEVRVFLCSGFSEHEVRPGLMALGASGFIEKPFTRQRLKEVLHCMTDSSQPSAPV